MEQIVKGAFSIGACLMAVVFSACGVLPEEKSPAPGQTLPPVQTAPATPAPSEESPAYPWEADPKGYVTDRLEQCLDNGAWTVRFWIMPGTGPVPVELPEAEYGQALRKLFSDLDWTVTDAPQYQEEPEPSSGDRRSNPYSIQIVPGYIPGYGSATEPIMCATDDPVLQLGIRTGEGYDSACFRAEGAEGLCEAIADLWPAPEAEMGRVRVLPREAKEATARAYLDEVCARLEANGHITGHEIRLLEVEPPYEPEGEEEIVEGEEALVFQALLALQPADPGLSCWQEGREETGWVTWGRVRVSLHQASDGFYTLAYFDGIYEPDEG